jgi:hypothetical protein
MTVVYLPAHALHFPLIHASTKLCSTTQRIKVLSAWALELTKIQTLLNSLENWAKSYQTTLLALDLQIHASVTIL